MTKQSPRQQKTIARVMHAFKAGALEGRDGAQIDNPKQAIAIALHEAGASRDETAETNARNRRQTQRKERAAQTRSRAGADASKAALYAEARRRDLPGRSTMTKAQLAQALAH